jgi:hypothetical protein
VYAAHFAAGLAIGSRAPRAPIGALLAGCFLPDLVWITLAASGIEPSGPPAGFSDDWSHSLLSVLVEATAFALFFARCGMRVWGPVWLAVGSHFPLDVLIHPKPLALYPHAALRAPWDLWSWGTVKTSFLLTHYGWVQLDVVVALGFVYALGARKNMVPTNLIAATALFLLGLQLLF